MSDVIGATNQDQALRLREVQARVGQPSKSTIYAWVQDKKFPPPLKLNGISVWLATDIDAWLREQIRGARHGLRSVGAT